MSLLREEQVEQVLEVPLEELDVVSFFVFLGFEENELDHHREHSFPQSRLKLLCSHYQSLQHVLVFRQSDSYLVEVCLFPEIIAYFGGWA